MKDKEVFLPFMDGHYHVEAGLIPLQKDRLKQVFDFDREFSIYRKEKLRQIPDANKRYPKAFLSSEKERYVQKWMIHQLLQEHPQFFQGSYEGRDFLLKCLHTDETLCFNSEFEFIGSKSHQTSYGASYQDGVDALAHQIQEDFAVWELKNQSDRMALCHLSFPNGWDVHEKMGKNFIETHQPVAEFGPLAKRHQELVKTMISKGPFSRFAWGLQNHSRLRKEPGEHPLDFEKDKHELYIRVERQTLSPLDEIKCSFFTIRTYLYHLGFFKDQKEVFEKLKKAVESMSEATLQYKNIKTSIH